MVALRITSRREGFRRCGVAHPAHPVDHPDGRWSEEEIARLEAEPMLRVERLAPAGKTVSAARRKGSSKAGA